MEEKLVTNGKNTMKAFVLQAPGQLGWEERPIPVPGPGQALIRSRMVGICGSDLHAYHGLQPEMTYPGIMGHEILGEIVTVNAATTEFTPGARVVIDPSITCGKCYTCSMGRSNVCKNLQVLGVHKDGGFAEYFTANLNQIYSVPDRLADEVCVLAEPLSIAAQAVDRGRIVKGDETVIFGAGPIGLAILELAKDLGARVGVVDLIEKRLEAAANIGADYIINSRGPIAETLEAIRANAKTPGPRVVVDAAAVKQTAEMAVKAVTRAGRLLVVGMAKPDVAVPYLPILKKELDVIGTRMTNAKFGPVVEFLSKNEHSRVFKDNMVTHIYPFSEMFEAFAVAEKTPESVIKAVIDFRAGS
jgi:L-gulonate 5-dehydrogenase